MCMQPSRTAMNQVESGGSLPVVSTGWLVHTEVGRSGRMGKVVLGEAAYAGGRGRRRLESMLPLHSAPRSS
jgi:hypothetical protein